MLSLEAKDRLRRALSGGVCAIIVVSYVTCISITKARGTYTGSLDLPFFSDTGRDPPTYYIFSTLNTIGGAMMVGFAPLQSVYLRTWYKEKEVQSVAFAPLLLVSVAFAIVAGVAASLLSIFDINRYPVEHEYSAGVLFSSIFMYTACSAYMYSALARRGLPCFERCMLPRFVVCSVLFVGAFFYLLLGLVVVCKPRNLSMADCLQSEPSDFCRFHEHSSKENMTNLWDYSGCRGANTMRTSSQFVCIISVLIYMALHVFDPPVADAMCKATEPFNESPLPVVKVCPSEPFADSEVPVTHEPFDEPSPREPIYEEDWCPPPAPRNSQVTSDAVDCP